MVELQNKTPTYLDGSRSKFPNDVDKIPEKRDLPPNMKPKARRFQELVNKDTLTSTEQEELNNLTIELYEFLPTAEDWNKAFDMSIATQKHYKDNTINHVNQLKQETTDFVNTKQQEMNTYITTKEVEFQAEVDKFNDLGKYDSTKQYYSKNFVHYNGEIFIALKNNLNVTPIDDDINWRKLTIKGDTGYGVGLSPKGNFSISTQYHTDDLVQYNGNLYRCVQDSINNYPTNSTYWELFLSGNGETLQNLTTTNKLSLVGAINEVHDKTNINKNNIGDLNILATTDKTSLVKAINEQDDKITSQNNKINNQKDKIDVLNTNLNEYKNDLSVVSQDINEHKTDYIRHIGYGADWGSANVRYLELNPAPTAYKEGMAVAFKSILDNTGAVTINVNELGAKSILKSNGKELSSGNLKAGSIYTIRYNGSNFILQGEGGEYGDAQAQDVLSGKTFGTEEGLVAGLMPNNGSINKIITNQGEQIYIPKGYHSGSGYVKAQFANLIAENIKSGVNVGGVEGKAKTYSFDSGNDAVFFKINRETTRLYPDETEIKTITFSGNLDGNVHLRVFGTPTQMVSKIEIYHNNSNIGLLEYSSAFGDVTQSLDLNRYIADGDVIKFKSINSSEYPGNTQRIELWVYIKADSPFK